MTNTPNTPLGIAMTQAILSVDGTRNDLIESCRRLRDDLDRLVTQHDNDALPTINALGIVQRQGSEIDRLCAVLDAQRKHVDALMFVQREQAGDVETHDDSDLIDEITVDILGYVPEGEDKDLEAKARKYAKDHVASCRRYLTYEDAYRVEVSRREGMCDLVNFVEACDLDEAVENIDSSLTTSRVIDARRADVAQDLEEFVYLALDAIL